MSASDKPAAASDTGDSEANRLVKDIEHTRADMSATIAALETRLNPGELRGKVDAELHHVEEKVREVVREHLAEAKTLVKDELVEAKMLLRSEMDEAEAKIKRGLAEARDTVKKDLAEELANAEAKIKKGLSEAKESVKQDLQEAVKGAKQSVRAATIGKVENLATDIGDAMNQTRDTLIETVRQNPIPAALAGVGLAWLLMNRSKSASARANGGSHAGFVDSRGYRIGGMRPEGYGMERAPQGAQHGAGYVVDHLGNAVHQATDAAGNAIHTASDAMSSAFHQASSAAGSALHNVSDAASTALHGATDLAGRVAAQTSSTATALAHDARDASKQLAHRAGDAATYVAEGARTQAIRIERGVETTLRENPLVLGAAALAVGAAVGFALPRTRGEDKLMGEVRDDVFHRAEDVAHDAAAAIGQFTEKTVEAAKGMIGENKEGATASR